MNTHELLSEIETFIAREDVPMTEATFGRFAVNDGKLVARLRAGRRLWPETAEKVRTFIAEYKPQKAHAA